jgi:hypothetical protein
MSEGEEVSELLSFCPLGQLRSWSWSNATSGDEAMKLWRDIKELQQQLVVAEAYILGMATGYWSHYLVNNIPVLWWMEDAAVIGCHGLPSPSPALEAGNSQSALLQVPQAIQSHGTDSSTQPVPFLHPSAPQAGTSSSVFGDVQRLVQLAQSEKMSSGNNSSQQPMDINVAVPGNEPLPAAGMVFGQSSPTMEAAPSGMGDVAGRVFSLHPDGDSWQYWQWQMTQLSIQPKLSTAVTRALILLALLQILWQTLKHIRFRRLPPSSCSPQVLQCPKSTSSST